MPAKRGPKGPHSATWQPGQSGNPKGGQISRSRWLSTILAEAGEIAVSKDDPRPRNIFIAEKVWEVAVTSQTTLQAGTHVFNAVEWFKVVEWLYRQIDGPPPAAVDVTSQGQQITADVAAAAFAVAMAEIAARSEPPSGE